MKFINLTPHAISVEGLGTFPASGEVARVSTVCTVVGEVAGIAAYKQSFGDVVGLPSPIEGTVYIVSGMVISAVIGRSDVVAPDTGSTAIRDEKGHIIAVRNFIVNF
jgi:acetyl-CoA carboxylase carboxyltransferase component